MTLRNSVVQRPVKIVSRRRVTVWVEVVVGIAMLVTLVPIVWATTMSFLPNRAIISSSWTFPFWLGNFRELFADGTFVAQIGNSVVIVLGTVSICLVLGSMAGYALARLGPPKWLTLPCLLLAAFIPLIPPMTLVPGLYLLLGELHVLGTIFGLVLVGAFFNLPFAVLLMQSYFANVSEELREASLIDGASEVRTFLSIMVPIVKPGLAAVGIFTGIMAWNEFLMGLTLTAGGKSSPVTVGIAAFMQSYAVTWGQMAAAGVTAAIPIIVMAIVANRQIVAGITSGAVKG